MKLSLFDARVLTKEKEAYKYKMGKSKRESVEMDWNWHCWYNLVISKNIYVCRYLHVYVPHM